MGLKITGTDIINTTTTANIQFKDHTGSTKLKLSRTGAFMDPNDVMFIDPVTRALTNVTNTNWDAAYNDRITAVSVSGGPTKTLTVTQQDGGTLTASWSDTDTDTNTFVSSAAFNISNGVLTLTRSDSVTVTVDLDGRFYNQTESDGRYVNVTGDVMTGALGVSTSSAGTDSFYVDGTYGRLFTVTDDLTDAVFSVNTISGLPIIEAYSDYSVKMGRYGQHDFYISPTGNTGFGTASPSEKLQVTGNILTSGTVTATGGNSTNWNTAFGWGNHASAGYQAASTAITTSNIGSQSVSNASTVAGLAVHTGRNNEANKVVRTDANGYLNTGWINTPSGVFTSAINKIYCSDDDYVRFQTPATFISNLGLVTTSNIGSYALTSLPAHNHTIANVTGLQTALDGKLSSDSDSEQDVGGSYFRFNRGINQISIDPRWNESGYDADLGVFHMYSTTAAGAQWGRTGIALYNGSAYQYLTTKSGTTGVFLNNQEIIHAGNIGSQSVSVATSATQVVTLQDDAPAGVNGKLWWETDTGKLKVYYGATSAWIDALPMPDVTLFYTKAGGAITGDVSIQQSLTVTGNILTSGTVTATGGNSTNWNTAFGWGNHGAQGYATQSYVNTAISDLVASAPDALDTLNELAVALGEDPNFATTIATSIGTKQAQLNGTGFVKVSGTTVSYDNSTYLTSITSANVTTALGYTPYNSTNPNGYITGISFANVSAKPTTISGYGITDAITTGNIGSQSVSYATSAGNADTVDSVHASSFVRNDVSQPTVQRHFDASTTWTNDAITLFLGWYGGKLVIGNNNEGNHDNAAGLGGNTIAITNTLYSFEQSNLYYDGSLKLYMGSDGTRNTGWAYHTANDTGLHWPNNSWHLMPASSTDFRIYSGSASESALRFETSGTIRGYVYASSSNDIGFLNNNRTWRLRVYTGGAVESYGDFRAPIFYDSDDTNYYGNFASTSRFSRLLVQQSGVNSTAGPALRVSKGWDNGTPDIIYDTVVIESNDVTSIRIKESDGGTAGWSTGDGYTSFTANTPMRFYTAGSTNSYIYSGMGGTLAMYIDQSQRIGMGTAAPTSRLHVVGNTAGADVFAVDGINGRLFTVSDDLSDSLFSVNTIAGLPVIEAFANNTVVIGKYGLSTTFNNDGSITTPGSLTTGGTITTPSHGNSSQWNTAYNKRPTAVAFSGTSTKTLTLTLGDGSTLTAAFNDIDTDTDTNTDGQTLSISGSTLTISGGNSISLPSGGISQATADTLYVSVNNNTSLNNDSRNRRGVTRLYRYDDDSDFSVQHYWTGSYWHLRGFNGDTFHADVQVGYADSAGSATSATTAGSAPNAGNLNSSYGVTAGGGNGLKFWNGSDTYKIHMGNSAEYHYGPVTDYSIKTNIDSVGATRGFTWGQNGVTPIAALNVGNGNMQIAGTFTAIGTITGSNLSGTNTGDQTNISGNAGTVTNGVYTNSATNSLSGILNFGAMNATPYASATGTSNGISFGGYESSSLRQYGIFTELENIGGNYAKLTFNWHTGIRLGASSSYGGTRFYNDAINSSSTMIFSVGNGDNHVRVLNNLYVTGTVTGSNLSGTNTGDQTNISGNAATATNVAWTGVTSRPTALSQFSNDLGNYGGWLTTSGKAADSELLDGINSSSFVRNDTTGQYLRAYYQYGSYLTTERPIDLRNQMGGSGMRVDFMNGAGGGSWNHVITFSGYDAYNMYQLGGYYDGGSTTNLYVRSEANHGTTSWTAWRRLLNEVADPYAVNMNQYVRTSDTVSFANFSGSSSGTNTGDQTNISGNAATATSATQVVTIQDAAPGGAAGKLWWESDTGKLKVYYNSAWVDATPVPDMSIYYAKAGGAITGDVTIQQTLTVVGNTLIQGTLTETSDISLKENILPLENSLAKVMKLNGVSFNKKATPTVKEIGFIAQEVEAVIPDLVTETNEGIKTVSYSRVAAVLVETIKEQQAQIDALTDMVNLLTKKLNDL